MGAAPAVAGLLISVLLLAQLAGCAGAGGTASPTTETKDRVTASDETDNAKRARFRLELAAAYFGRGQLETALDELKQSIAADPTQPAAFNLRGLIYASFNDTRLADESFRRALQLDPQNTDAMQNFAWYLCQQKRFDEAEAMFSRALAVPQYAGSARTMMTQGICHARAGQLAAAERTLLKSYEADPRNPATSVNLAEVLLLRGDAERARFYVRRVNVSNDYANAQSLWLAARIENRLGNREGVAEVGARLRNRFPESREAAALEQGRFDE